MSMPANTEPPAAGEAQVFLDFDGTITQADVLDELIVRYSRDDSWKRVEQEWQAGRIGSRACLAQQFDLLDISRAQLDTFLDQVAIDPGTTTLVNLLRRLEVPVAILSDGIDFFIERILRRHGLDSLTVRANTLVLQDGRWKLRCPWSSGACTVAAAHCKCASDEALRSAGRKIIYVGDGRSDLCPARGADLVFAKNALATCLAAEGVAFQSYHGLADVAAVLSAAWAGGRKPLMGSKKPQ
jgi:2-hydroxy-3-keto-5-methylthiopentenyl-1-phosphate phosphatase